MNNAKKCFFIKVSRFEQVRFCRTASAHIKTAAYFLSFGPDSPKPKGDKLEAIMLPKSIGKCCNDADIQGFLENLQG